jgi:hypothetical protein
MFINTLSELFLYFGPRLSLLRQWIGLKGDTRVTNYDMDGLVEFVKLLLRL